MVCCGFPVWVQCFGFSLVFGCIGMSVANTQTIEMLIQRFAAGDESAKGELIGVLLERFRKTASRLMKRNPRIRRWEATDDVLQQAMVRMSRCLDRIKPNSATHLFSLVHLQISRELTDMARKYYGPQGMGHHHATRHGNVETSDNGAPEVEATGSGPEQLAEWLEFHDAIDGLEEPYKSVFSMAWYDMMTHDEMAAAMGCSTKTIQRYFRKACLQIRQTVASRPGT